MCDHRRQEGGRRTWKRRRSEKPRRLKRGLEKRRDKQRPLLRKRRSANERPNELQKSQDKTNFSHPVAQTATPPPESHLLCVFGPSVVSGHKTHLVIWVCMLTHERVCFDGSRAGSGGFRLEEIIVKIDHVVNPSLAATFRCILSTFTIAARALTPRCFSPDQKPPSHKRTLCLKLSNRYAYSCTFSARH